MSPADLDLHDGYNRREKQQRSRVNGRLHTFDRLIGQFGANVVWRRGSVIQSIRTRIAKRHHPQKSKESDFSAKTVLNIDMTFLLERIRLECLHNFGYFAPMTLLERSMCFFCGLGVSKRIISLDLC